MIGRGILFLGGGAPAQTVFVSVATPVFRVRVAAPPAFRVRLLIP